MKDTDVTITFNQIDLATVRRYLRAQRRGEAFDADDHENVMLVLRRVGAVFVTTPDSGTGPRGTCRVCGCTEKDACVSDRGAGAPACSWEPGFNERLCTTCADA
jgi:hypothetical protein